MNFNKYPYYDDFDANKKFLRVLFRPGYAVQGRELTQIQSLLQNQIESFGNNVFQNGTVITGCAESHNFAFPYVKIKDTDNNGNTITLDMSTYVGQTISNIAGVSAVIRLGVNGSEAEDPNLKTLYIQYVSSDQSTGLITEFAANDVLTLSGAGTFVVTNKANPTGEGSLFSLADGIVYANGMFVVNTEQTIVIDPYNADGSPTQNVGFILVESIVTSDDDGTLLDPAQGSYNWDAPGADRYQVSTQLVSYTPTASKPDGFFLLFEVNNGAITRSYVNTQYGQLAKELAQRTYDESGNYVVQPFPLIVSEDLNELDSNGNSINHGKYTVANGGDNSKLVVGVGAGKAYVRGFEQELYGTQNLIIDKGIDTSTLHSQYTSTNYGNYVEVDEVAGPWNIYLNTTVALYDTAYTAVSGGTYSSTAVTGSQLGTAKVRNIEYVGPSLTSGGPVYHLYLYDINMTSSSFDNVKGIFYGPGGGSINAFATIFPGPHAVLLDTKYPNLLFPLPEQRAKSLDNITYVYRKQFTGVGASGSQITLNLSGNETFAFSSIDPSVISNNVVIVAETAMATSVPTTIYSAGQYIDLTTTLGTNSGAAASVSPTQLIINLTSATLAAGTHTVTVYVNVASTSAPNGKSLNSTKFVAINTATNKNYSLQTPAAPNPSGPWLLGVHDAIAIQKVWASPGTPTIPSYPAIESNTSWTDVTSQFVLNTGVTDSEYGMASMSSANTFTNQTLVVMLSWYSHGSVSGYYSAQSYPLPAENVAPTSTQIEWYNIPKYTTQAGIVYDLRDTLDFRPTVKATSGSADDSSTAVVNEAVPTLLHIQWTTIPEPTAAFISDITYHLPRIDRIVLDSDGDFLAVRGSATDNPVQPDEPDNAMTLGFINVPAYPSLSPYYARVVGRPDYATSVSLADNKRYTMQDIGYIDSRLQTLEYYTSLSLLEQNTASMFIPNSSGMDRYKNGILVDPFNGHNIGNVFDPTYNCSISSGELRPAYTLENINLQLSPYSSNIVRNANDAIIVVQQLLGNTAFGVGNYVTSSGTGTGTIVHVVTLAQDATYRWVRLYLKDVSGTFAGSNTINGISSNIITYGTMSTSTLATALRPSLVVVPTAGWLATLPYEHGIFVENLYASKSRNCVSPILFTFEGVINLTPPVDSWVDTNVHPEVQSNDDGFFDNWISLNNPWGTQWEDWNTLWLKNHSQSITLPTSSSVTPTASQRQAAEGISLATTLNTDVDVIPYIRSQIVGFTVTQLKPNSRVYPFFDGEDVSIYCRTGSSAFGTALLTDAYGNISGQFRIPAATFTAGSKIFTLTNDATDPTNPNATVIATGMFTVSGITTYDTGTVVSTQKPEVTYQGQIQTQNLVVNRLVSSGNLTNSTDPMAQTFFVSNSPNGVLATKADIYFATKSLVSPIALQIREVINGYPSDNILPFSTVSLTPAEVNISTDASAVTVFTFPSPVYLKNDTEYCITLVPAGNDDGYAVWVSELGQTLLGSTEIIDKQPNAGSLFGAGNNRTWAEFVNESITFALYTATFNPTVSGQIVLNNAPIDYLEVVAPFTPNPGDVFTSTISTGIGTVQYFDATNNIAEVQVTSGQFELADNTNGTALTRTSKLVDAISPAFGFLSFNNTAVAWGYKIYGYDRTPFIAGTSTATYSNLLIAGTTELSKESGIFSYSDIPTSFSVSGIVQTTVSNISPIIDLSKMTIITIANQINNNNSNETGNSGSALSRYITRTVVLDDGQDAEDLLVYVSASLPAGSSISVYAKLLNNADGTIFDDRPWTVMGQSNISGTATFKEYYFTLPAGATASLGGGLDSSTGIFGYTSPANTGVRYNTFKTFAVKIVPTTPTTTVNIPIVQDLRIIALQV